MTFTRRLAVAAAGALLAVSCSTGAPEEPTDEPPVVQLGAPGEGNRDLTASEAAGLRAPSYMAADVDFVRMMIPHHEQALEMTAMVPSRSARDDLPLLAERLEVSQTDEIAMMEQWLAERGQAPPPGERHAGHGDGDMMPGMLTDDELSQLAQARGTEFDRLFLQFMIRHHEGALVMVEDLLSDGRGGQEPQIFQLAQHIDADQRVEISRMKQLLGEL